MEYREYVVIKVNSCAGGLAEVTDENGEMKYAVGSERYRWLGKTAEERHALKEKQWFYASTYGVFDNYTDAEAKYNSLQKGARAYFDRYGTALE